MRKYVFLLLVILTAHGSSFAQRVLELTERNDLRLQDIQQLADQYFDEVGRDQGSGYKQFQRWLYEARFHTDTKGFLREQADEWRAYLKIANEQPIVPQSAEAKPWKEMGPFSWNRTSGWNPGVGRVTAIAVHPLDTNIIYLTSPGGGLWKSTLGGNNWLPLTDNDATWMNLYSVAVDPTNTSIVYVGNSGGGVMKSINGGTSFTTISNSSGISGTVRKIFIHPGNSNIVFVCSSSGIHRSTNGGSNWTQVLSTSKEDIECKPDDANVMYASGSTLHRSVDNGLTWTAVGGAQGVPYTGRMLVTVSAQNPQRVYLLQAKGSILGYIYRSDDAGLTFTITVTGSAAAKTNYFGYNTDGSDTRGQATYDMAMCANPENANELHIAGIICFRSVDGGYNFVAETAWSLPNGIGYNHADVHVLNWVGKTIYSGSDGGIYKSTDLGDNWMDLSNGMATRQFYKMANATTSSRIFTGGAQDNGSSVRRANGWADWLGADGMDCIISPLDSNLMIGTSQNGSIYRTTNGGSSYGGLSKPPGGNWVTPLAIEANSNVMYGGWKGVYRSTNNGSSWSLIFDTSVVKSNIAVLAIAPSNPQYIYASIGSTLYITKNQGASWSSYVLPAGINSIAVSPANPEKIWLACNTGGAFRACVSTNAGQNFTDISSGLPGISARSVTIDNDAEESVYYGMNIGVFFRNNNMPWTDLSTNLPKVAINEVEIQPNARMLRVATYGRGIWQRTLAGGYCNGTLAQLPAGISGSAYMWQVNNGTGFMPITNNSTYSGANTATLSVGTNASQYNYEFRCAITVGSNTVYSQVYKLKFSNYWTGDASSEWNNPVNWSCGVVPGAGTDVVVSGEKNNYPIVLETISIRSLQVANGARIQVKPGHQILLTGIGQ